MDFRNALGGSKCGNERVARSNKLIDTDVLSAGFASLLSAGHCRR